MATRSPSRTDRENTRRAREAARQAALAKAERKRRWTIGAVVASAVVVLGAVAGLAFGGSGSTQGYSAQRESFDLPGLLRDQHVRLADHRGTPVVVNFFASWCVYCNEELPGFVQVAKATKGKVDFIGVDTYDPGDGAAMARRFDLAGAGFALAHDVGAKPASDLWRGFGGQGLPVTAFYDANGKLVDFSGGMLTQDALQERLRANFGVDVSAPDAANLAAPVIPLIPRGAYELLARNSGNPSFVALDVRTPAEFAGPHLPGAVNLDVESSDFSKQVGRLDKDKSYFVYCQTGNRSSRATQVMHDLGFKHVYDIEGGITGWQQEGLPVTQ